MASLELSNFYIYRWRFIIGYGLIGLALVALLTFAGLFLPGGVSQTEMSTVIKSDALTLNHFSGFATANLPYYALQALSLHLFGVHDFSIKLPSLVLGFASAVALIFLLHRWFSRNIAILGSIIAVTTGQFLFVAQNGTPGVLYIFWPAMLLLLGTLVTRSKTRYRVLWKLLFFITVALSLYTPLSIYPLLAMFLASLLHPHLRNVIRNLSKVKLTIFSAVALVIISPLIYGVIKDPTLALTLLGVPAHWSGLLSNIVTIAKQYVDFWHPSTTTLMTPVFGLGTILLIAYGLYHLIKTRDTTQSYLILIWLICLVPVLVVNPSFTSVTFVPLMLLLTTGLSRLTRYWYRMFPRNPYARIVGLIPLLALVLALTSSGLDRYAYGYYYQPETTQNFSKDLTLIPENTAHIVVSNDELAFYQVVARHDKTIIVSTTPQWSEFIASHDAGQTFPGYAIQKIITSSTKNEADRFYVYKKTDV